MAASLRSYSTVRLISPLSCSWTGVTQKRWHGRRKIIYKSDGAHHVPGIPVHPDRKFPKVDDTILENAEYPPIKPKFPPGSWGNIDREHAWMWHSLKEKVLDIPTVSDRLNIFLNKKQDAIVLDPINDHPAKLAFRQYVTKTDLIPWSNDDDFPHLDSVHNSELLFFRIKQAVTDHLVMENEAVCREKVNPSVDSNLKCSLLFRCISDTIIHHMWKHFEHLQECQYDEDVTVRALWHRFGVERETKDLEDYSTLEDLTNIVSQMDQTIVSEIVFDAMLRSHLPLPQIEARDSEKSTTKAPSLPYKVTSYGHKHSQSQGLKSISAGYADHRKYQHAIEGDPCQFGLVGFLSTWETSELQHRYSLEVAQTARLAMGLTSSFTWLAAQAMNQGFSDVVDMTYPLVSQTVLSDGRTFSFLKYQLNTLELWKPDDGNNMVNLCWHTEEAPLYHSVENGQVNELNEDVLKRLVEMFLTSPEDRGYDLRPTVQGDKVEGRHTKEDYIPQRVVVEEVVEEEKYIIE